MKHVYLFLILFFVALTGMSQKAASFDELTLTPESYWNGSDDSGKFKSSNITFQNSFNAAWFSWSGFAYSNITDTKTKGWMNQYSAITGSGRNGSANYGVAYVVGSSVSEFETAQKIRGLYVTNATYAFFSMKEGDDYSKKFGGTTGIDPDYFKIIAEGFDATGISTGKADFYLADFRSDDNSKDYIVSDWAWFDLSTLGVVKEVKFYLESSDNGTWGMNTPAYFCVDDVNGFGPIQLDEVTHATFDDILTSENTYYNGDDLSGGFYSGNFYFKNNYNADWYSWTGFAVSNTKDTQTAGWTNQYSAIPGVGVAGSPAYTVVYPGSDKSEVVLKKTKVTGFYVSNSAYAYWSMKNGDDYSKKFGGADGKDPDWFKLTIKAYSPNVYNGHIDFYLADFRSDNSSDDYIVTDWQWIDISALGEVDRLEFTLSSSDNGLWGMNTPAYFVMDNLNRQIPTANNLSVKKLEANVYPNPFVNELNILLDERVDEITLFDITGKMVRRMEVSGNSISLRNLDDLHSGIYMMKIRSGNQSITQKLMKK